MTKTPFIAALVLLASASASAQKCPTLDIMLVSKGFADSGPWRIVSGGPAECSFRGKTTSINFGFNHAVSPSAQAAETDAAEMRQAVAAKNVVEPMPALGEKGIVYQPKKDNGQVDPTSMFFYGHRGTLNVSGYLNLKDPITPEQRTLAANLIATTLGMASNPKALAKASTCKYVDPSVVGRLLSGEVTTIVPDANNCVLSSGGDIITIAVAKDARSWSAAEGMLKNEKCTVDAVPGIGKGAGIAHHCGSGNPRAEVVVVNGGRWVRVLYAPPKEPSPAHREALVELARFAAAK